MSAGPLLVGGLLLLQRPGIDPIYGGPTEIERELDEPLTPTPAQLSAIDRVVSGSRDAEGLLQHLKHHKHFQKPVAAPASSTDRYAANLKPYPLMLPEAALYGKLGELARSMQSPLSWAYPALLPLYAGLGINLGDPRPRTRGTVYVALMGKVGDGKSVVMSRAQEVLGLTHEDVETNVAASDRGILNAFRKGLDRKDDPGPLRPGVFLFDEMITLLNKMAIQGSSLQQMLCEIWSLDRVGVSDKFGPCEINARVSMLGNLKLADRDEFAARFAGNTADGFYSRMILAPGPEDWRWDLSWEAPPHMESIDPLDPELKMECLPRPTRPITVPKARLEQAQAWEDAHRANGVKPGRLTEMATRVALITASASGEGEISSDAMTAALAFADWQRQVRSVYCAGEGTNEDAILTGLMLDAFADLEKNLAAGTGKRVAGKPIMNQNRWASFRLLQQSRNWHKKYSATTVSRVMQSLCQTGLIERHFEGGTKECPSKTYTNKYRLIHEGD